MTDPRPHLSHASASRTPMPRPAPQPDTVKIITGVAEPWGTPGETGAFLRDLYDDRTLFEVALYTPAGPHPAHTAVRDKTVLIRLLATSDDRATDYEARIEQFEAGLRTDLDPAQADAVVHCHGLTSPMTQALTRVLPDAPRVALLQGIDLARAERDARWWQMLRRTATAMAAIVVPSAASGERLRAHVPDLPTGQITLIRPGIEDYLVQAPGWRWRSHHRDGGGQLRILFDAGSATAQDAKDLAAACRATRAVSLTMVGQLDDGANTIDSPGLVLASLGHVPRDRLRELYAHHDVLVKPARSDESLGLNALEAQAHGLPVLYQPVPGLAETVGAGGLPCDLTIPQAFATTVARLRQHPDYLRELAAAGYANAARYPLTASRRLLHLLSSNLLHRDDAEDLEQPPARAEPPG